MPITKLGHTQVEKKAAAYQAAITATHVACRKAGQEDWNAALRDEYRRCMEREVDAGRTFFVTLKRTTGLKVEAA